MRAANDSPESATRRSFLRNSSLAAGGIAAASTNLNAQDAPSKTDPGHVRGEGQDFRASTPSASDVSLRHLGPLAELAGTWVGTGFNLVLLPDFQGHLPFRVVLNTTIETLAFTPVGGKIPNRGSGQDDIFLHGLSYLQRVSDSVSNGALHVEPGLWLHVPPTTVPNNPKATVVRQATIPHGDSLLAQGDVIPAVNGPPKIGSVSSTPKKNPDDGTPFPLGYLDPLIHPTLPPGFKAPFVADPNLALQEAIQGQNIVHTVVLAVSTTNNGGILNIPFVVKNANATSMSAIFWIETVQQNDGSRFMQLQYTQTVILNFLNIDWPHISVATLVKQ